MQRRMRVVSFLELHVSTKMCTAGRTKRRGKRIRSRNQVNGHQLRSSGSSARSPAGKQTGWSRASQSSPRSRWEKHTKGKKREKKNDNHYPFTSLISSSFYSFQAIGFNPFSARPFHNCQLTLALPK